MPVDEEAVGKVKVTVPALLTTTHVDEVVIDALLPVTLSTGLWIALWNPTKFENVLAPPNVCVVALTTPIVELPANAIDITGVVVPVATLKPFAGLPALTLVTVPLPPVADNVPLAKDKPVPIVTVANLSVEDNPANLVAVYV